MLLLILHFYKTTTETEHGASSKFQQQQIFVPLTCFQSKFEAKIWTRSVKKCQFSTPETIQSHWQPYWLFVRCQTV